jgi:NAD(P)-dependent dehydrogenase (short-subunit alcohol dehydrogenase family)
MSAPQLAVVTGGASGMGEAAALLLSEAGWPVLLSDLHADKLNHAAERLAGEVEVLAGDISDSDYASKLIATLAGRQIGALVHCAGLSPSMADPARILDVNLAATMRLIDAACPHMAPGSCAVLFSSSGAHLMGSSWDKRLKGVRTPEAVPALSSLVNGSGAAYTVSKRAVMLLVERMSPVFGARGARIVSVSPGIIDTPMGRVEMEQHAIMHEMMVNSPLSRSARPEEVAAIAVFLCTPAASFITGTDILVDGGKVATVVGAAKPESASRDKMAG